MKKTVLILSMALLALGVTFTNCKKDKPDNPDNPDNPNYPTLKEGINLTIFAFNNGIKYKKDFTLVDGNSAASLKSWIDNLNQDDGTALFYTIDNALDGIKKTNVPSNLNGVYMVTFTDGIDNASVGFNDKYTNRAEYQEAMRKRIANEKFHDFQLDAYGIGVPSADVGNNIEEFNKAIKDISSSSDNAFVLDDFSKIQAQFSQIASSITTYNTTTDITFKISYGGTDEICLVFDGFDYGSSQFKIQAKVNSDKSLSNIQYTGITSSSGNTVQGADPDGALYHYAFTDVKKTDGTTLFDSEIKKAKLYRSSLGWGVDSEFNPASATNTTITRKTAVIALVLDISSSLGSNLANVKTAARSFIDNLVSPIEYCTVTYSANGGIGTTPNAQAVEKGETIILASGDGLEKTGFTFDGWNTKADGTGTNYDVGSSYTVNNNITFYAKWKPLFTVVFDINGGDGTAPPPQTVQEQGMSITLPSGSGLNKTGFTFDGWNTKADGTGTNYDVGSSYTVNNNITLYAKWIINPGYWTRKADFVGGSRSYAVGFSIDNKGYIGMGGYRKDFWEYNPTSNIWTQKADFAGENRVNVVGFSIGNKGYIGLGSGNSGIKNDFWEYNPTSNTWTQKADFAGGSRYSAVGFSIGDKGYIGMGYDGGYNKNDFWEYNPTSNTWTQKANFAGGSRSGAVRFSIGNKGYIGMGSGDGGIKNDFWEYNPTSNIWTKKANFASESRYSAVGFSIDGKGYIGTGRDVGGSLKNDFWEYNPTSNTWTQKANFAGESRWGAVGFFIGNKGYVGTGQNSSSYATNDFWEFTP